MVELLRRARYVARRAVLQQERFPKHKLHDVEGLMKLVDRSEVEPHDCSLTPGRYVGVTPRYWVTMICRAGMPTTRFPTVTAIARSCSSVTTAVEP